MTSLSLHVGYSLLYPNPNPIHLESTGSLLYSLLVSVMFPVVQHSSEGGPVILVPLGHSLVVHHQSLIVTPISICRCMNSVLWVVSLIIDDDLHSNSYLLSSVIHECCSRSPLTIRLPWSLSPVDTGDVQAGMTPVIAVSFAPDVAE